MADEPVETPEVPETPKAPEVKEPKKPDYNSPSFEEFMSFDKKQLNEYVKTQAKKGNSTAKLIMPAVEVAERKDELIGLRGKMPSVSQRKLAYEKGVGRIPDQEAAINRMLQAQKLEATKAQREQKISELLQGALSEKPTVDFNDQDTFTALNITSMTNLGKEYKDAEDMRENFRKDAREWERFRELTNKERKKTKPKYESVGVMAGEELGKAAITGTSFDKQQADTLKPSAGQILFSDETGPEMWESVSKGLTEVPFYDEFLDFAFENEIDRREFKSNAYRPQKKARAMNVYKPLYQDPTGKLRGIDLHVSKQAAKAYYVRQQTKNRALNTFSESERNKIRQKAEEMAEADVSTIERHSSSYVYHRNDDALDDFLEGEGVLGKIAKVPALKPIAALFLPHRKVAGEVGRRGEEAVTVADQGVLGTYVADNGLTRSVDSLFRYAPSESVGAAYHLAHKDYIRQFGDEAKGRGTWIAKRMTEIWDDDRLVEQIGSTTDNAGRLLTEAGEIMLGEWGEKHPTAAKWLFGVPTFGLMLIEPDVFWGLAFGTAGVGTVVGKAVKGVRTLTKLRKIDMIDTGVSTLKKAADELSEADRANPEVLAAALQKAQKADKSGAAGVALKLAGADVGAQLNVKSWGGTKVLMQEVSNLKTAARASAKSTKDAEESLSAARAAKTADEEALAIEKTVLSRLDAVRHDLDAARAEHAIAKNAVEKASTESASVLTARSLIGDEPAAAFKAGRSRKRMRAALTDKKVQKFLSERNVKVDDLLAKMDVLYPMVGKLDPSKASKAARKSFKDEVAKLLQVEAAVPLAAKQSRHAQKITKALAKQAEAAQNLTAIAAKAQRGLNPRALARLAEELESVVKTGTVMGGIQKGIDGLEQAIRKSDEVIQRSTQEIAIGQRIAKRAGDEVLLTGDALAAQEGAAQLLIDTINNRAMGVNVEKSDEGQELIEGLVGQGRRVKDLAKTEVETLDRLRKLAPEEMAKLSDEEFTAAMLQPAFLTRMWATPEVMNMQQISLFTSAFKTPRVWMAAAEIHVADLVQKVGGAFRTRVGLMGDKLGKGIDRIAKRMARLARAAEADLGLIFKYVPEDEAGKVIQQYLAGSGVIRLREGVEISGNIGLGGTYLTKAMDNFEAVGRAIPKDLKLDDASDFFERAQTSVSLQGFVKALVPDDIDSDLIPLVNQAIVKFVRNLAEAGPAIRTIEDAPEQIRALQTLALDTLRSFKPLRDAGMSKALDDIPQRSLNLSYRSILGGAIEEMYAARVANFVGPGIGLRTMRAYQKFIGRGKENLLSKQTIEPGDMVVLKTEAESFRRVTKTAEGAKEIRGSLVQGLENRLVSAPARRIEQIFTDADGIQKAKLSGQGGEVTVPLADLARRDPELSFLDVADAYLVFGPDLIKQAYKKDFSSAVRQSADDFTELIVHSRDAAGNFRVLPKFQLERFSKGLDNIAKNLTENLSDPASRNIISRFLNQKMVSGMINLWKRHVLGGMIIPNPAFFMNNQVGDFSQMAMELSFREAAQISLYGGLGYLPYVGPRFQDAVRSMNQTLAKTGVPLPSLFGAQFNRFVDEMLEGVDEVRVYKLENGKEIKINPAVAMREALEDGIDDSIRQTDWADGLRKAAEKNLENVEKGIKATSPLKNAKDEYLGIMDITMRAANRRQRALLYWHSRFNKGMARDDAADLLHRSLYDYQLSVGRFETEYIAKWSAFYVFSKNAMVNTFHALFDGSDDLADLAKRYVRFNTKQQRIEAMSRFADVLLDEQYVDPALELTPGEQRRLVRERELSPWLSDYMVDEIGTLTPEGQKIMKELGVERVNFAKTASTKLTSVEFLNMYSEFINLFSGAAYAGLRSDVDFDTREGTERVLEEVINMMNPLAETAFKDTMRKALDLRTFPKSEYGKKLTAREIEFAGFAGAGDVLSFRNVDDKLRSNNILVKAGLLDMSARELDRLRLMGTVIFGPEAFGKDLAPADLRAYLAGQDKSMVQERLQALGQLLNVQRVYLYHGDENAYHSLREEKRVLRSRSRKAGKEGLVEE
jgi:hypothetical protein